MFASSDELQRSLLNKIFLKTGGDPSAFSSLMASPLNLDQAIDHFLTNNSDKVGPSCSAFSQSYGGFLSNQF